MEIIKKPNNIINKKLIINIDNSKKYRWLYYIYKYDPKDGYILLYNTLTTCLIRLTKEEYNNPEDLTLLKELCFYVPEDYQEYEIYQYFFRYYREGDNFNIHNSIWSYTILSTLKCNARCKYCYELGNKIRRVNMSNKTINNTIKLIVENYENNHQSVNIGFFGGEPFYYQEAYDKIFTKLKELGIPYTSNFISNGYLFDDKTIDKMINLYNCKNGQVTIDGTEENYNKIKNYIYKDDPSPFKTVINNIKNLLKNNIKVVIRINFDYKDYSDQLKVGHQLLDELKDYNNYSIYFHELYEDYTDEEKYIIRDILINLRKEFKDTTFFDCRLKNQMPNMKCMADTNHNVLINSNGDLYKCEHIPKGGIIGNINKLYDEGIEPDYEYHKKFYYNFYRFEECKKCPLCPECIMVDYCSYKFQNKCELLEKLDIEQKIENSIKNMYKDFLNS